MIRRYLGRLSGPLLDRIDLHLAIEPVSRVELAEGATGESSDVIRDRVRLAQERAVHRWGTLRPSTTILRREHPADPPAMEWLHAAIERSALSTRSLLRVLRLSWSIADLRGAAQPGMDDVAEALTLRLGASEVLAA
jgi:magnesium chelatase family protein